MSYTAADAITYLVDPEALTNLVSECSVPGVRAALIGFNEYSKNLINLCPGQVICIYEDEDWKQGITFRGIPVIPYSEKMDINKVICCSYKDMYEGIPKLIKIYGEGLHYYYPPRIEYKATDLIDIAEQDGIYRKILADTAHQPPGMMNVDKIKFLMELLRQGLRNTGVVVEMGVWQGASSWCMAKLLSHLGEDRDLYMCDLFESHQMDRTATMCNDQIMRQLGFYPKAHLLMGLVDDPEVLKHFADQPICFAHFDLGFIPGALEVLWRQLQPGSTLLLDNYGHIGGLPWGYDAFFAERGSHVIRLPWSEQGLVVK